MSLSSAQQRASRTAAAAGTNSGVHSCQFLASALRQPSQAVAVVTATGEQLTYGKLVQCVAALAIQLRGAGAKPGDRVLILTEAGPRYVVALYAVWHLGLVAVPLCSVHTLQEHQYYATDSGATIILHDAAFAGRAQDLLKATPSVRAGNEISLSPSQTGGLDDGCATPEADALFIYTSGTTGAPKGAVHTHSSLYNMSAVLVKAWGWDSSDSVLHVLPLHHLHGLVNLLLCPLLAGSRIEFMRFNPAKTLTRLAAGGLTLFMAVPTIYAKLLEHHRTLSPAAKQDWKRSVSQFRLMVSGSSALPPPTLAEWQKASGLRLLERYGMTELGMILSQKPEWPDAYKISATVGVPLPGVEIRVRPLEGESRQQDDNLAEVGELLVKSPACFSRYWGREKATRETFSQDGYFLTGDIVGRLKGEPGTFRILGRASVDIIKSAGYKLSALEIEAAMLKSDLIDECVVVGIPDDTYGEVVAAVVKAASPSMDHSTLEAKLRAHAKGEMAPYKAPRVYRFVDTVPRSAIGKINKKQLRSAVFK
eukprot:Hpha_TRINITY_DN15000_c3_g2::TRINITY_DN15000_c3_g2_i1::g.125364::m.125364/K18660/ACSF3; malonyl-CoA/methylmalonyl-CoA synthetase